MNTKRRFMFGLFSVFFLGKKTLASEKNEKNKTAEGPGSSNVNDVIIKLMPGQKYALPSNPTSNQVLLFVNGEHNLEPNPAYVFSSLHKINGEKNSPVVVDMNSSFSLRYLDDNTGWSFSFI